MKKKKNNLSIFIIPLCIAFALTSLVVIFMCVRRNYAYRQVDPIPTAEPTPMDTTPRQTHIEGVIVCLPHKDTTGPQTDECAIGIQTNDGNYYALDTSSLQSSTTSVLYNTGNTISADGMLTPIENLNSDQWQKYNVQGIFSVTNSLEQVNNTP